MSKTNAKAKLGDIFRLIISIAVCLATGIIGSGFTRSSIPTWYAGLNKPSFAPPNQLFAPVWTALYVLMGISAYIIWRRGWHEQQVKPALGIFALQLILNVLWSIIFFGLRLPFIAFLEIIVLWFAILFMILQFKKLSAKAALLQVPYIIWVSFASLLNFFLWVLNS